ncbi:hypothetical protein FSB73_21400 [Arachidicoccus ginsenosidivorans]|uniref:Uncharacterized protein n=1 Tax=Arachidicoccus ginsenosidivorans TaxID=496057 RepID=A0A5B8VQE7_9BACT|nr:hypothetical protein [Arachidicoccus ginsenosidivorans]QEC73837.1 hypothetical protein FSB73_21400 [Arachidicoccus ginsenosidivorans]
MKSKNEFLEMVYALRESGKRIASKTKKAFYSGFRIEGDKLHFYREGPQTEWTLNIEDLWKVYCTQEFINTSVVKKL